MTIDERTRRELYLRLEAVLGVADAETLMDHLPPVGWAEVATTRDVDGVRSDMAHGFAITTRDVNGLRNDMENRFAMTGRNIDGLRDDMENRFAMTGRNIDGLRNDMEHGFAMVQTEFAMVRSEIATQRAEILTLISDRLRAQTWVTFSALVAGIGAAAAISRI